MAEFSYWARTSAGGAGDGSANNDTDAYDGLSTALSDLAGGVDWSGDDLTIYCSVGSGSAADTTKVNSVDSDWTAGGGSFPNSLTIVCLDALTNDFDENIYRLDVAQNYGINLYMNGVPGRLIIDGIQTKSSNRDQVGIFIRAVAGADVEVRNCFTKATGASMTTGNAIGIQVKGSAAYKIDFHNNVSVGWKHSCIAVNQYNGQAATVQRIYNNTVDAVDRGIYCAGVSSGAERTIRQNVAQNASVSDLSGANIDTFLKNIDEDGSGQTTATVVFDAGADVYTTSDVNVVGQGDDLSALYALSTTDRLGNDRGALWDIGAYQHSASGETTYLDISGSFDAMGLSSGAALKISSIAGNLESVPAVNAVAGSVHSVSGDMEAHPGILGEAAATKSVSGYWDASADISGSAALTKNVSGSADALSGVEGVSASMKSIGADIRGTALTAGSVSEMVSAEGSLSVVGASDGALALWKGLAGSLHATTQFSGSVFTGVVFDLTGSITAVSKVGASTSKQIGIGGSIQAESKAEGSIGLAMSIRGSVRGTSMLQGGVSLWHGVSGSLQSEAYFTGNLDKLDVNSLKALAIESVIIGPRLKGEAKFRSSLQGIVGGEPVIKANKIITH